jgi:hypothetical protein
MDEFILFKLIPNKTARIQKEAIFPFHSCFSDDIG